MTGITVGETGQPADICNLRGTVTISITQKAGIDGGQPMIAINAALIAIGCRVRLSLAEAAVLRDALDRLVFEASGRGAVSTKHRRASPQDSTPASTPAGGPERSIMRELLSPDATPKLELADGRWLLPGTPP